MPNLDTVLSLKTNQTFLNGVQEIIGADNLKSAFNLAGIDSSNPVQVISFSSIDDLHKAFDELFGTRGCQGVMQRSGRASFRYFLREFGQRFGLNAYEFRLLPNQQRLQVGLKKLARFFSNDRDLAVKIGHDDQSWYWKVYEPQKKSEYKSREILCQFSIGFLQDFLSWCGNGNNYQVTEVACPTGGGQCYLIKIDKKPLE